MTFLNPHIATSSTNLNPTTFTQTIVYFGGLVQKGIIMQSQMVSILHTNVAIQEKWKSNIIYLFINYYIT